MVPKRFELRSAWTGTWQHPRLTLLSCKNRRTAYAAHYSSVSWHASRSSVSAGLSLSAVHGVTHAHTFFFILAARRPAGEPGGARANLSTRVGGFRPQAREQSQPQHGPRPRQAIGHRLVPWRPGPDP